MISEKDSGYRKNFSLIVTFIVLISLVFILSLFLAYNFSKKNIENDEVIVVHEALQDERKIYLNRIKRPYLQ